MKQLFLFLILPLGNLFAIQADDIVGIWYMEKDSKDRQTVVEIFKHNDKYYANGFAYTTIYNNNTSEKDIANPDPNLQNRLIKEIVFLYDLEFTGKSWSNGEIYNLENGKCFYARAVLDGDLLKVKASVDKKGRFGKTLTWKKSLSPEKYQNKKNSRKLLIKNIPKTFLSK